MSPRHNCNMTSLLALSLVLLFTKEVWSDYYTAAVVEYHYSNNPQLSAKDNVLSNVETYVKIISNLEKEVDIVVFPENGFTGHTNNNPLEAYVSVPAPSSQLPSTAGNKVIKLLSDAAKNANTYVVVNLLEKDGGKRYNTNVVFRKNGTIAARYRKYNLFLEKVDREDKPGVVWFDTEWGVRFGVFTCFDILFDQPALELVRQGVRHFVYPTHWFGEMPFLTAVQYQWGWARATASNLLAAGLNQPDQGSTGSGIYPVSSDGNIPGKTYLHSLQPLTRVIVSRVPFNTQADGKTVVLKENCVNPQGDHGACPTSKLDSIETSGIKAVKADVKRQVLSGWGGISLKTEDLTNFTSTLLQPSTSTCQPPVSLPQNPSLSQVMCYTETELCSAGLCCSFNVNTTYLVCPPGKCGPLSGLNQVIRPDAFHLYRYRMMAFSGTRSFNGAAHGGVEVCGLVPCADETSGSCGQAPSPSQYKPFSLPPGLVYSTRITFFRVTGNFSTNATFPVPSVLESGGSQDTFASLPKTDSQVNMFVEGGNTTLVYRSDALESSPGPVAIYSRVFLLDVWPSDAHRHGPALVLALLPALLILLNHRT